MNLLGTVPKALGITGKIQMAASLDHSMWFYEPFDMSQPLLFFMQTQVSSNGRGLATGRFYSQKGTLLAVVVRLISAMSIAVTPSLTVAPLLPLHRPYRHRKAWCARATTVRAAPRSTRFPRCDHVEPVAAASVVDFLLYYHEMSDKRL